MTRFRFATTIHQGQGSLSHLAELPSHRVLVITDPFLAESETMRSILGYLGDAAVQVFSDVKPDPTIEQIGEGLGCYITHDPDTVIGLGGGSALDTAKAVVKLATEQGHAPANGFVAIPSTSGSGSEVTSFAVISSHGRKEVLVSDDMAPEMAILDPSVTTTLPPSITADTGMDAITHAIEAYVNKNASDFSDALAEKAAQLAIQNLATAVLHGDDLVAREKMHNASTMAALAFDNSGLGITHSLAHALGAHFHLPHGRLNAILLPTVMEFNAGPVTYGQEGISAVAQRYAHIAHLLGLEAATRRNLALSLCAELRRLRTEIGIPDTISAMGVDREELRAAIPQMAADAMEDACTPSNPVTPTVEDLAELLKKVI